MTAEKKRFVLYAVVILVLVLVMTKKGLAHVIGVMAEAIKSFEGWQASPPSVSYRNNNPGNIKDLSFPGTIGPDSQGHAIFESYQYGWQALVTKLERAFLGQSAVYLPTMTLYEFFGIWAAGNSGAYAEFVAARLGVSPSTKLQELIL